MPATMADTVEFKYNGLGQRTEIIEKHGDTVLSDKSLLWVDGAISEERNATGTTVSKRYFSQGFQIASGDNQGNYCYSKDHLGSIREVSNAAGTVVAQYDYDLWGRQTKLSGTMDADFGFTGFYVSRSTGLDLTWYRAYSSEMGRWLSRDPLENAMSSEYYLETGESNLFNYCQNMVLNSTDKYGLLDMPSKPPSFPKPEKFVTNENCRNALYMIYKNELGYDLTLEEGQCCESFPYTQQGQCVSFFTCLEQWRRDRNNGARTPCPTCKKPQ